MENYSRKEMDSNRPQKAWIERLATRQGTIVLACASLVLLVLAGLGTWYVLSLNTESKIDDLKITPPASLEDLAREYPDLATILLDPKLGSVYKDFLVVYQRDGPEAAYEMAHKRGVVNDRDEIRMTLELDTTENEAIAAELEASGIIVTAANGNLIDIAIPLTLFDQVMQSGGPSEFLEGITNLEHVVKIRLPIPDHQSGVLKVGDVESESLSVINAYAWQEAGFTGEGIKIGVLDFGFDRYKSLLGNDLPEYVTALSFIYNTEIDATGIEHGTACAEIIHDLAPGAELFFAAIDTNTEWYEAVDWLLSQGVDIISYSGGSSIGPFDGTSRKARRVDEVVSRGVLWVNAAGNEADIHYRGSFTDEDGDGYHEFGSGDETLGFYSYSEVELILDWDAWDTGDQDFDLYLLDENGDEIASSEETQAGSEDGAVEAILYDLPYEGNYSVLVYAKRVTRPVVLDFFAYETLDIEYLVPEHSLSVPADARRALAVGATNWEDDSLEEFSSQGPTSDGRIKPELTAPDNVSSEAYGETWVGTSAAAPHVSGASALLLQGFPGSGPDQIIDFLKSRAVDLGEGGPDNRYGYGRLWLGDPPEVVALPEATRTGVAPSPEETSAATQVAIATKAPAKTSTATRRSTATPKPESNHADTNVSPLALLGCVITPGVFALGSMGLLGGVLYWKRSQATGHYSVTPLVEEKNVCPRCNTTNRPQARFCNACGLALGQRATDVPMVPPPAVNYCSQCGHKLLPDSSFCVHCGLARTK